MSFELTESQTDVIDQARTSLKDSFSTALLDNDKVLEPKKKLSKKKRKEKARRERAEKEKQQKLLKEKAKEERAAKRKAKQIKLEKERPAKKTKTQKDKGDGWVESRGRKKKAKGPIYAGEIRTSTTVQLFDRDIEMKYFPETTSLYSLCHAWMRNDTKHRPVFINTKGKLIKETTDSNNDDDQDIKHVEFLNFGTYLRKANQHTSNLSTQDIDSMLNGNCNFEELKKVELSKWKLKSEEFREKLNNYNQQFSSVLSRFE